MKREASIEKWGQPTEPRREKVEGRQAEERAAVPSDFGTDAVPLRGAERRAEAAEQDARMRIVVGRRWR